ncbi:hypothetical protein VCUG_00124 [Vavraia culicis subsp. floridensis]|uniref:Uncharacterized protein n=1 Tax=Vavraia culicis (isolate floridensis) TaxID=948595 RepID=L2GYC5_VAVCU|nr:uncharacterized protein VCUG_00124 [Vavraia culicis subsp. floridensis]ELA48288.1 hypothetical protein VCUG_00124 [Vavraia culicis subsp. floridensis]
MLFFTSSILALIAFVCANYERVLLIPKKCNEDPGEICKLNGKMGVMATARNLPLLINLLQRNKIDAAAVSGWNGTSGNFVLRSNGALAPYEPLTNQASYAFCYGSCSLGYSDKMSAQPAYVAYHQRNKESTGGYGRYQAYEKPWASSYNEYSKASGVYNEPCIPICPPYEREPCIPICPPYNKEPCIPICPPYQPYEPCIPICPPYNKEPCIPICPPYQPYEPCIPICPPYNKEPCIPICPPYNKEPCIPICPPYNKEPCIPICPPYQPYEPCIPICPPYQPYEPCIPICPPYPYPPYPFPPYIPEKIPKIPCPWERPFPLKKKCKRFPQREKMVSYNPIQPTKGDTVSFTQECISTEKKYVIDEEDLGTDQRVKVTEITDVESERTRLLLLASFQSGGPTLDVPFILRFPKILLALKNYLQTTLKAHSPCLYTNKNGDIFVILNNVLNRVDFGKKPGVVPAMPLVPSFRVPRPLNAVAAPPSPKPAPIVPIKYEFTPITGSALTSLVQMGLYSIMFTNTITQM